MRLSRRGASRDHGPNTLVTPEAAQLKVTSAQEGKVELSFYGKAKRGKGGYQYTMVLTAGEFRRCLLCSLEGLPASERKIWDGLIRLWEKRATGGEC